MAQVSNISYTNTVQGSGTFGQNEALPSETDQKDGDNKAGNSVYGGDLNLSQDLIAQKQALAGKQAIKQIMDVFSGEQKVDDELEGRKDHVRELESEIKENQDMIRDIQDRKSALMEQYGVKADSEEESDLNLLKRRADMFSGKPGEPFSKEEWNRLQEIDANGRTDYLSQAMELYKQQNHFNSKIEDAKKSRAEDNAVIRGIHKARLKQHDMVDAEKAAQTILEDAGKEVVGMMMDQAVETQDQKMDDIQKEAEERKEDQQETEEKTGKTDQTKVEHSTSAAVKTDVQKDILQAKADQMVAEKKITEEDIKGIVCDQSI